MTTATPPDWNWRHAAALLVGNVALAFGPWSVRLSDAGSVATAFWRLLLALPLLAILALANRQALTGFARHTWLAMIGAGAFFALNLASWHIGMSSTRLGNATLFGNASSIILMVCGLIAVRRAPSIGEWLALLAAMAGTTILFGRSLSMDLDTLIGDMLCLLAGLFFVFYVLLLQGERARIGNWSLLFWSGVTGIPILFGMALWLDEKMVPDNWWPIVALALGSQIVGQGLVIYSLRHFPPLVIGLMLLTQPGIAILIGWFAFGETLNGWDAAGMLLVAAALVLARAGVKPA